MAGPWTGNLLLYWVSLVKKELVFRTDLLGKFDVIWAQALMLRAKFCAKGSSHGALVAACRVQSYDLAWADVSMASSSRKPIDCSHNRVRVVMHNPNLELFMQHIAA